MLKSSNPQALETMLSQIQHHIQNLYQIECPFPVDDFLLDAHLTSHYEKHLPWIRTSHEALLVLEKEGDLEVGLFFHDTLLAWGKSHPFHACPFEHLAQLNPLIEGVSHFVYLLWKAGQGVPITALEMELQAEVDKFLLLSSFCNTHERRLLIQQLFEKARFRNDLSHAEEERYQTACKLALKYCYHLNETYLNQNRWERVAQEVGSFYRLNQQEKIRKIQA